LILAITGHLADEHERCAAAAFADALRHRSQPRQPAAAWRAAERECRSGKKSRAETPASCVTDIWLADHLDDATGSNFDARR
jgi:hypothetical protein